MLRWRSTCSAPPMARAEDRRASQVGDQGRPVVQVGLLCHGGLLPRPVRDERAPTGALTTAHGSATAILSVPSTPGGASP